jgi:hypothetical protein
MVVLSGAPSLGVTLGTLVCSHWEVLWGYNLVDMVGLFQSDMSDLFQLDIGDLFLADPGAHMCMFLLWW